MLVICQLYLKKVGIDKKSHLYLGNLQVQLSIYRRYRTAEYVRQPQVCNQKTNQTMRNATSKQFLQQIHHKTKYKKNELEVKGKTIV